MKAPRLSIWLTIGFLLAACAPDTTSVTTQASTPPAGPVITGLNATPTQGVMALIVNATDPTTSQLSYSWSSAGGQLSATTGPSVLWQPPKAAGAYTVTVTATDPEGLKASASQQFTVDGSGQAQTTGTAVISNPSPVPGATVSPDVQNGQFQVPSPLPNARASFTAVGGVTIAPSPSPTGPVLQVVATPAPGPSPIATPPGIVLATPQASPPVMTPAPSPLPTPPQATPQPGVSLPPVALWSQVPPSSVGTTSGLNGFYMEPPQTANTASTEGWAVGFNGTIVHTTNSGQSWVAAPSNYPDTFLQVFFASQTIGYILSPTEVIRTLDGGQTWATILSPQATGGRLIAMSVFNAAIITVSEVDGTVMWTQNATTPTAASVGWSTVNSHSASDPTDATNNLACAAVFPTASNTSVSFMGGSPGVFRTNFALGAGAGQFIRAVFNPTSGFTAIGLDSENDLWAGTGDGHMFHTANAEATTPTFTELPQYTNADSNGVMPTFNITSPIQSIDFVNGNNGWFVAGGYVYNTTDGSDPVPAWHSYHIGPALQQIQIEQVVNNGQASFVGWGIAGNQVWRYGF